MPLIPIKAEARAHKLVFVAKVNLQMFSLPGIGFEKKNLVLLANIHKWDSFSPITQFPEPSDTLKKKQAYLYYTKVHGDDCLDFHNIVSKGTPQSSSTLLVLLLTL